MRWSFFGNATEAHGARQGFAAYLRARTGNACGCDEAELIFGELIANVVQHAPGPVEIDVEWEGDRAVLTVCDRGPAFELRPSTDVRSNAFEEHGRGLFLVSALAARLGVRRRPGGGTCVEALLPVWGGKVAVMSG